MFLNCDLHTHTIESHHAYSTVYEYVQIAKSRGIKLFATTDHGPSLEDGAHPWHFNNLKVVPRVCEGIGVLRGAEANISEDGSIDLNSYHLKVLDIVLAGMHPVYPFETEELRTNAYLNVIKSGRVDVITHPGQVNFTFHYENVLTAARDHNVAIEINSSSDVNTRKGSTSNCIEIARMCKRIGTKMIVGSDAHICYALGNFDHAYDVLKAADVGEELIINSSPLKVLDFLESRGHAPIDELRQFFIKH